MPKLGAYDSGSVKILEQHAKWIGDAGAGAINVSWWGRDSDVDRRIPVLMDVMAAHDIKVSFHLEPYRDHHALAYADDIDYLIRQYGDRRRWDCFLLLRHADGAAGPVFKSFRTIVPASVTDCHGRTAAVADFAADSAWREQTDRVRERLAPQFARVTLLADSLDVGRTEAGGFDGIAIYDNYVRPASWRAHAEACSARDLVFSFNVNPGFDGIVRRQVEPDSCYTPPAFEPVTTRLRLDEATGSNGRRPRERTAHRGVVRGDARRADRPRARQREARVFSGLHQLVQRMARGPSVRADARLGRPDAGRARRRLSQSGRWGVPIEGPAQARSVVVRGTV